MWIYIAVMTTWTVCLCVFHSCIVATEGRTAYERIKRHYMEFEQSPHKRGSSCVNFCQMVCCKRRKVESRLDRELDLAQKHQDLNQQEKDILLSKGIIENQPVPKDVKFCGHRDMQECPEQLLTFTSCVHAEGNLNTFRRIKKKKEYEQDQIVEEQNLVSGARLMTDAYKVNETESFYEEQRQDDPDTQTKEM